MLIKVILTKEKFPQSIGSFIGLLLLIGGSPLLGSSIKMSKQDAYKILGFTQSNANPTQKEVKKRYKKLAFQWHPDKNLGNKTEAEEKFKKIAAAYERLTRYGHISNKALNMSDFLNTFDIPILSNFLKYFDIPLNSKVTYENDDSGFKCTVESKDDENGSSVSFSIRSNGKLNKKNTKMQPIRPTDNTKLDEALQKMTEEMKKYHKDIEDDLYDLRREVVKFVNIKNDLQEGILRLSDDQDSFHISKRKQTFFLDLIEKAEEKIYQEAIRDKDYRNYKPETIWENTVYSLEKLISWEIRKRKVIYFIIVRTIALLAIIAGGFILVKLFNKLLKERLKKVAASTGTWLINLSNGKSDQDVHPATIP